MGSAPEYLEKLVDRWEPDAFDARDHRARIRLETKDADPWDVIVRGKEARLRKPKDDEQPDALLSADEQTWRKISHDLRGGMEAYNRGRLRIRHNLHLGVGFLAASSGLTEKGRLEFHRTKAKGCEISYLEAGTGDPVISIHGLGGTKGSFLPTVAALADDYRVIALDLPGFGDSDKPFGAAYDAAYFADITAAFMEKLEIEKAHLIGNSMGGRVALELGFDHSDKVSKLALLAPSLAWLRERRWAAPLKLLRPELGILQPAPRPIVEAIVRRLIPGADDGWTAAGVDEFLRAYLERNGRAAFYAAARNIYLEEPHGEHGFWTRLKTLQTESLFVWGKKDNVVPIAFARHVEEALPAAEHVEIAGGPVPQVERPRETHQAVKRFLKAAPARRRSDPEDRPEAATG
jgi:pimeloyl-ACP methyl ester carboxylesterase/putative sterol carrier protein